MMGDRPTRICQFGALPFGRGVVDLGSRHRRRRARLRLDGRRLVPTSLSRVYIPPATAIVFGQSMLVAAMPIVLPGKDRRRCRPLLGGRVARVFTVAVFLGWLDGHEVVGG